MCRGLGGLGGEAVDDGAGCLGAGAACLFEAEPVLVGQHYPGVGAGQQGHHGDGVAGFGLAGADALQYVPDRFQPPGPAAGADPCSEAAADQARSRGSWPSANR